MLDLQFIREKQLEYHVLDISDSELAKAPDDYSKITVDMCAPPDKFAARVAPGSYDLIFTHNFLEHIARPDLLHRNIHSMLKPGCTAVHLFPCSSNVPLAINKLLPEGVTRSLVSLAQPGRDTSGKQSKFKAYYKLCGAPSARLERRYADFGFDVLVYKGFVGHSYYDRFAPMREIERALRKPLASLNIPMVSNVLLVLRKKASDSDAVYVRQG